MGIGQKVGFRHSEESKAKISEGCKGKGRGGFNVRVLCPNCGQEMSPANLAHHQPECEKYGAGRIKEVKALRIRLRQFGLTVEQYEAMSEQQQGRCAVCGGGPTGAHGRLCVDHDHGTGKVRGLLCGKCNQMLGLSMDNADTLRAGAAYLDAATLPCGLT